MFSRHTGSCWPISVAAIAVGLALFAAAPAADDDDQAKRRLAVMQAAIDS